MISEYLEKLFSEALDKKHYTYIKIIRSGAMGKTDCMEYIIPSYEFLQRGKFKKRKLYKKRGKK